MLVSWLLFNSIAYLFSFIFLLCSLCGLLARLFPSFALLGRFSCFQFFTFLKFCFNYFFILFRLLNFALFYFFYAQFFAIRHLVRLDTSGGARRYLLLPTQYFLLDRLLG